VSKLRTSVVVLFPYLVTVALAAIGVYHYRFLNPLLFSIFLVGLTSPWSGLILWFGGGFTGVQGALGIVLVGMVLNAMIILVFSFSRISTTKAASSRTMSLLIGRQFSNPFILYMAALIVAMLFANHMDKDWDGLILSPGAAMIMIGGVISTFLGLWLGVWLTVKDLKDT
jgi:hypothetical protein